MFATHRMRTSYADAVGSLESSGRPSDPVCANSDVCDVSCCPFGAGGIIKCAEMSLGEDVNSVLSSHSASKGTCTEILVSKEKELCSE